jgi:hypothetical protein
MNRTSHGHKWKWRSESGGRCSRIPVWDSGTRSRVGVRVVRGWVESRGDGLESGRSDMEEGTER